MTDKVIVSKSEIESLIQTELEKGWHSVPADCLRAILDKAQPAIPEGYALVKIEPTEAMKKTDEITLKLTHRALINEALKGE